MLVRGPSQGGLIIQKKLAAIRRGEGARARNLVIIIYPHSGIPVNNHSLEKNNLANTLLA